tara:strand:+ start:248 stop:535 length:288 start_codon:yes stop_codon:yes gene_type:complete
MNYMSEQAFIDMADDFKNLMILKDLEVRVIKEKLLSSRKDLLVTYAAIRLLDERVSIIPDIPEVRELIENLRTNISYCIEKFIIDDVGGPPDDDD